MLLAKWICAHLIGDFLLQSGTMVRHKQRLKARSWMLYLHVAIHGLLVYGLAAQWYTWWPAAIVTVSHFFIDWWKLTRPDKPVYFIIDQLLHVLVLVLAWCCIDANAQNALIAITALANYNTLWLMLMGYLLLIWPFSIGIGFITQRWRPDVDTRLAQQRLSLAEAGRWIGVCERILVYTFILTQQFAGIGFLITAKSILRFNDTQKEGGRKEAEYILIGTLLSFAVAIITGLIILKLINTSATAHA
ncbi:MAG: DUF3307 domain-containing protein [Bacteroidetes bacterium]|nr:MAG: DUF3307 domain-containing protein [Bacteroidota bacterium]